MRFALLLSLFATTMLSAQSVENDTVLFRATNLEEGSDLRALRKNLARWHMGVSMFRLNENGSLTPVTQTSPEALGGNLLGDNPAATTALSSGESVFVLDLGEFFRIDLLQFRSFDARGRLRVDGSLTFTGNESEWTPLYEEAIFGQDSVAELAFPVFEARYLRLRFNTTAPGEISALDLRGSVTLAETTFDAAAYTSALGASETETWVEYNFASLHNGARVLYVSGEVTDDAFRAIDDNLFTAFRFGQSRSDSYMILDLGVNARTRELSMLLDAGGGEFSVYRFAELPEFLQADTSAVVREARVSRSSLDALEPDRTVTFEAGARRMEVTLGEIQSRYMMVKWTPAPENGAPLQVYELALLGRVPPLQAQLAYLPRFEFFQPTTTAGGPPDLQVSPSPPPLIQPVSN